MAGLNHDFLLLECRGDRWDQLSDHFDDPAAAILHDDVLQYMGDTLAWIPSSNPSNPNEWPGFGLNWAGPTAIEGEGALVATAVFASWADLLAIGPETFHLRGDYSWREGEPIESGHYARIEVDRDRIVGTLRRISQWSQKAAEPSHWLLHLGI